MGSLTTFEVISIFSSWDPGQTFGDPSIGEYRVKDIFQYIQKSGKKPKPVPLNQLMEEFLSGESDAEVGSDEFSGRSDSADTNYPIIVIAYREGYLAIADGRHRFYKTLMQYYNRRFVEIVQSLDMEVSYPKVKDVITRVKDVQRQLFRYEGKYQEQTRALGKILLNEVPDNVTISAYIVTDAELMKLPRVASASAVTRVNPFVEKLLRDLGEGKGLPSAIRRTQGLPEWQSMSREEQLAEVRPKLESAWKHFQNEIADKSNQEIAEYTFELATQPDAYQGFHQYLLHLMGFTNISVTGAKPPARIPELSKFKRLPLPHLS